MSKTKQKTANWHFLYDINYQFYEFEEEKLGMIIEDIRFKILAQIEINTVPDEKIAQVCYLQFLLLW